MRSKFMASFALFSLVLALAWAALGQHGQGHGGVVAGPPPAPDAIEVPAKGASLPMQDFGGRPVVDVKINGKGPYRFVLGTAATLTAIDSNLHRELALPLAAGVQAAPVGGQAPLIVRIEELRIGDAVVSGMIAAAMPLGTMLPGDNAPRGIVSASLFQGYLLTYDYPAKRISIAKGKLDKADAQSIFEYSEARPTVTIKIAGRQTRVQLDTGSGSGLTLPTKFLKELPLASPPKDAGKTKTPAGEFPISSAPVNGPIELGKYQLKLSEVSFSDARTGAVASPGSIGYEVLRHFVVTLDPWNRRIRFVQ